jgi:hypothetical protein
MKSSLLGLLCFTAALWLHGQAVTQLDVSMTSLESTKAGKVATLHVQNNSGKDVAAFHLTLTVHHADGTTSQTGSITDFGYRATKEGDPKRGIPKLLIAGESYDDRVVLASDVMDVTAKLSAVVYANRTAHGDPDAIGEIVRGRQKFAEHMTKTAPSAEASKAARYAKDDIRRQP